VARINSPGGSATASEAIRAALERLAKKKPLVISMGNMAASGGYWISCVGRPVYAEPETLTGSIGVFALKLSFGPFLKKIGVKMESVTLDESAGATAIDRGWTPTEQERMQGLVDDIYDKFLKLVAHSRKLKLEQVAPIAGGRVWSGVQAEKLALVDKLGGLDQALAAAASEAGLEPGYQVIHRPRKKNLFELFDLFEESTDEIRNAINPTAKQWLREAGFDLTVPLNLARESLKGRPPKVWLLAPAEMVIR
jgi:protease-4